jgi:serine/threonine protein kinase
MRLEVGLAPAVIRKCSLLAIVAMIVIGGNAVVIKALNSRLQGIPPPELEQMLAEKFQSEAAILNKIRHANIVSVLDQGDGEDATGRSFSFIVLEFMSGGDFEPRYTLLQMAREVFRR